MLEVTGSKVRYSETMKDFADCEPTYFDLMAESAKSHDATMFSLIEHIEMLEAYYAAGRKAGIEYAEDFEDLAKNPRT